MREVLKSLAARHCIQRLRFEWQRISLDIANVASDSVMLIDPVIPVVRKVDCKYLMSEDFQDC